MLDNAFAHLKCEIQAGEAGVAVLEMLHNSERMEVVIEALSKAAHLPVQLLFSGVGEWRMTDIVDKCEGFCQILVEFEHRRNSARDLRDLNRMRQTVAKVIGNAGGE